MTYTKLLIKLLPVVVAVDDVADRHLEPRGELRLEPPPEVAVDRVAHDDALGRHQEHRVVVVVLRAVELTGDIDDTARGRLLGCGASGPMSFSEGSVFRVRSWTLCRCPRDQWRCPAM